MVKYFGNFYLFELLYILQISECSAPSIRGRTGSLTATFLAFGILVAYLIGAFVEWYVLAYILSCFPMVLLVGMCFLPETPIWLLSHGFPDKAKQSLQRVRGKYMTFK